MSDHEELDEDLFADLYEGDDTSSKPAQPALVVKSEVPESAVKVKTEDTNDANGGDDYAPNQNATAVGGDYDMNASSWNGNNANQMYDTKSPVDNNDDNYGPINVKEDGKMFIGGLNWETTEQSLKDYFSQFGEVSECTVMRDSATGRSRGFGFLTFRDPKCVNTVMVKEHYLDGKIIDPKRAIPREEQERTAKIFVGGVSQEATEEDFKNFFKRFGRVVDATLMMDKDTGRPRGFGFVTFDGDAAVDATLAQPLEIHGKLIEVKRAQPRGNMRDGEDDKKFGGRGGGKFGRNDSNAGYDNQQNQNQNQQSANPNQMTPAMMAQYWQRMQQYFAQMQQNIAAQNTGMGQMGAMGGGAMNPAMMQHMMAMQQGGMNRAQAGSPLPPQMNPMQQMNPAMMQQMNPAMMQQMQMQQQHTGGGGGYGNHQEQLAFEQQKYEQQQARRMQQTQAYGGQGGPTAWDGMYDDAPQPSMPPQGPSGRMSNQGFVPGHGRGNRARQGSSQPPTGPSNAPPNAPTGPKNANKPGVNYRGGYGGRGSNHRHSPYGHHGRGG